MDLFYAVKSPYRKKAVWVLNDTTVKALRKLKDNNGNYIWQPSVLYERDAREIIDSHMRQIRYGLEDEGAKGRKAGSATAPCLLRTPARFSQGSGSADGPQSGK